MDILTKIYRRYGQELFGYLCWLTKDPHRAEDILQETFLRAIKGILRFEGRSSLKTWIFSIARNCYIDDLRKSKDIKSLEDIPELVATFDLELEILDKDMKNNMKHAMEILDERSQKVIQLRNQGYRFSEIGVHLDISEGSARVINHRAVKKLRQYFKKTS